MNEYKSLLQTILYGGGYGVMGAIIGIAVLVKKISVGTSIKYSLVAFLSGVFSLQMAEQANWTIPDHIIAVLSGLFGFFIIKIVVLLLFTSSDNPDKSLNKLLEILKSFKK